MPVELQRFWAMPSASTFTIPPIRDLLDSLGDGSGWVDPYAGTSTWAEFRNDLSHLEGVDAVEYLFTFDDESVRGLLIDPPYSHRQISEVYEGYGTIKPLTAVFDEAARILQPGGKCISFGWNSNGAGRIRGFVKERIMLIAHGGNHNDTIVTVEKKAQRRLQLKQP